MASNDIASRMNDIIEKARIDAGHSYNSRDLARELVVQLRKEDAGLLEGWLAFQAEVLLWGHINHLDASDRSRARRSSERSVFAGVAAAAEAGDTGPMVGWLATRYVVETGDRVALADLKRGDLEFVAQGYRDRAANSLMHAAFLTALAKKIEHGTVADTFSDDEIARLWNSISGPRKKLT